MSGSANFHAKISPSGLDRTTVCTASNAHIDKLIEAGTIPAYQPSNKSGAIGTYAHDLAEEALLHITGQKKSKSIEKAKSIREWLSTKECKFEGEVVHKDYGELENYIDYCMSQVKHEKDKIYVEVRSKLFYSNDKKDKGTCDFLILHFDRSITIVDLKWRRSGMVESYQNKQLSAYAYSFLKNNLAIPPRSNFKIKLTTYNPLVSPYVEPWVTTVGELISFCNEAIQKPVDVINDGSMTMFVPTEKACLWCPANKHCAAKDAKVLLAFPNTFDVDSVKDEDLVGFLKIQPEAESFFKGVSQRLFELADRGQPVQGTKLVEGRSNRRYADPQVAGEFLTQHLDHEDVYDPPKIKSFTKVTPKLTPELKKQFEKEHLIKPPGSPKLVLSDDVDTPSVESLKSKLLKSKQRTNK